MPGNPPVTSILVSSRFHTSTFQEECRPPRPDLLPLPHRPLMVQVVRKRIRYHLRVIRRSRMTHFTRTSISSISRHWWKFHSRASQLQVTIVIWALANCFWSGRAAQWLTSNEQRNTALSGSNIYLFSRLNPETATLRAYISRDVCWAQIFLSCTHGISSPTLRY